MAQVNLNVEVRENSGKGVSRRLRAEGKVPAVVYGKNVEATAIAVDSRELEKAVAGDWNTLLTLKGDAAIDGKVVVVKDADFHPLRRDMVCADFHVIDLQKTVSFMVPVNVVGTAEGQKMGGTLQLIRKELEVLCLPTAVPSSIDINVEELMIGDTVHIDEVVAPEGVEMAFDVNFTVITLAGHKEEEEEGEEGADGEEGEDAAAAE